MHDEELITSVLQTPMPAAQEIDGKCILICSDSLEALLNMKDNSIDCCVTSPPYYALRDYGTGRWEGGDPQCDHVADPKATKVQGNPEFNENRPSREGTKMKGYYKSVCPKCGAVRIDEQIGLEESPEEYIDRLVSVFREVRRVLKPTGTLWINIGDSYWGSGSRGFDFTNTFTEKSKIQMDSKGTINLSNVPSLKGNVGDYKDKDLIGIPWMLAFALRADGWYLRQDIIWAKPNCMPESVHDRCTKSHEYIFLLTKSPKYYYDADAIRTPASEAPPNGANKRDVWFVPASGGYTDGSGAHYATYNPKLIEPCIYAGCPAGGVVLDPFNGTGTTGVVALDSSRKYIGIDLSKDYISMSAERLGKISAQYTLWE